MEICGKKLRDYQRDSISSLYKYWMNGGNDPSLIVIPTGAGKSLISATLIKEIVEEYGARILVLTHVSILVQQNTDELLELWPEAPVGIFSAGLKRKEIESQIIMASIQSIEKHVHRLDPPPEIVLIDEAHLIPRKETTRYSKCLSTLKSMYPKLRVVGLTATPFRIDSGWLHKGDDAFFKEIVYDAKVQKLIDDGYLSPVISKCGSVIISTEGLHKQGKDWNQCELEARAMEGDTTKKAVEDIVSRANGRKKWLIFACGKEHAMQILNELEHHGINSGVVLGDTGDKKKADLISGHKYGDIRALISVNVLSTGYNNPSIDLLALMRPSESASWYVQAIGRAMRKAPGKIDALILDYAGVVLRHGPIDAVDPDRKPGTGDGVAPSKVCPECESIIAAGCRHCPDCGYEFPPTALKVHARPTEAPILKSQITPTKRDVVKTSWYIHRKPGRPDSVRIEYEVKGNFSHLVSEWIFPEVDSEKCRFFFWQWCKDAGVKQMATAERMVEQPCPQAVEIHTMPDGKFFRVVRREWK